MESPLADLRIVAVEQYGAGPWATMQLADLGADVIKVEDPTVGGDVARYVPPFQCQTSSLFFESFNRGKRSVRLNLRDADDRERFHELVAGADAVFSNLRGDGPAKLGLQLSDLESVNPRIVCCSLSAFGMSGPRAREGGYDHTIQGLAGWQSLTGGPDEPPTRSGLPLVDLSGGYVAALAIVAGVWRARREGVGADIDLSLFEVALSQLSYVGTWSASTGYAPERQARSAHLTMVPFQNFPTADGWLVVACPKQNLWRALCEAIERPDLAGASRYETFAARNANREPLVAELDAVFRTRTTDEWVELLTSRDVPASGINSVEDALHDPQVVARQGIQYVEHPVLGKVRQVASPLRIDGWRPPPKRGPLLGEHDGELFR